MRTRTSKICGLDVGAMVESFGAAVGNMSSEEQGKLMNAMLSEILHQCASHYDACMQARSIQGELTPEAQDLLTHMVPVDD